VAFGILLPLFPVGRSLHRDLAGALATAVNDWQAAEWLDKEPRLRASIVIPYEFPDLAVAEIERRAGDRRFVQALFLGRPHEPMGRPRYWPIYEACERLDLPVSCHAFFSGGNPITGAGWPSFYYEDHVGPPQAMEAHVVSLAVEGVFERFPKLRVVSPEHSFGWLPALLGRLDAAWGLLRSEVPHLRRPPAEYVREHVWVCTQPMDEPPTRAHVRQLLHRVERAGVLDRLVYASDYPHWDWDAPDESIPAWLPADVRRRIYAENARELYRL
jgi:predicted TIM-barrel fold metal-dependent hydrolase